MAQPLFFNEFNIPTGKSYFLPLVSGVLSSYLKTFPELMREYNIERYFFRREPMRCIFDEYVSAMAPYSGKGVACFSVSMWNEQISLRLAEKVKQRWPGMLIIFGGAQVPHSHDAYLGEYSFIDMAVRGEGETQLQMILERHSSGDDYAGIPGLSWRGENRGVPHFNSGEPMPEKILDRFPSPYLDGTFDALIKEHPGTEFKVIIETNRGCPFNCTYCYWGMGGLNSTFRHHSLDRVREEILWFARNKVEYVFCADSNFGMHKRDMEIAELLVSAKTRYGYPHKFRACYGKNASDRICAVALALNEADMSKGITLSLQTTSLAVMKNVRRDNIKFSVFRAMQERMVQAKVPVYTELILGLPGETLKSWMDGLNYILADSSLSNQLFIYPCCVFVNSEMGSPAYKQKHAIVTRRIPLLEIHGTVRGDPDIPMEYQNIIVGTSSMTIGEWRRMSLLSWMAMLFFSMKVGYYLLLYLMYELKVKPMDLFQAFADVSKTPKGSSWEKILGLFAEKLDGVFGGEGLAVSLPEYGDIYWDVEEAGFFLLSEAWDSLYAFMEDNTTRFLDSSAVDYDRKQVAEVIAYQRLMMPEVDAPLEKTGIFSRDWEAYFSLLTQPEQASSSLDGTSGSITVRVAPRQFFGDKKAFAREVMLYGRKSDRIIESNFQKGCS